MLVLTDMLPGTLIDRSFRERIILVGVAFPGSTLEAVDEAMDELAQLVDSAGADVVARVVQRRDAPDPATFVGRGKAEEIAELSRSVDADTVVFDEELSPAQQRNLEKVFGRTAIDRTAVILDIFAQNARSPEGKAQVELALLRYRLPRLRGRGGGLSASRRAASGPGARGRPSSRWTVGAWSGACTGSSRTCARWIARARLQRRSRARGRHRELALVGYTNAGKSTLLNQLTDADVAGREPALRHARPAHPPVRPAGRRDGAGDRHGRASYESCPTRWSRRSGPPSTRCAWPTSSSTWWTARRPTSRRRWRPCARSCVRSERATCPELIVVNKADRAPQAAKELAHRLDGSVLLSAQTGEGIDDFLRVVADRLRGSDRVVELVVPWARGDILAAVHREGEVVGQTDGEDSATLQVVLDEVGKARFAEFVGHLVTTSDR